MAMTQAPLLQVEDLRVHFKTQSGTVRAVDGVDFSVAPGETLGLVGESGSGKTISCLALLRLVPRPAEIVGGSIQFEGADLLAKSDAEMTAVRGKRMAMVFQNPAYSLNPIYSVGSQLGEIVMAHERVSKREARARVSELLRLVGITDATSRIDQFPHELSGGMKQRVCIARALLCNPALLLADEPTTNLDVTIQAQILDLLGQLKQRFGTAMLLVTHDMGVVARMADRITVMYAGRICETADPKTIFHAPRHPYTQALLESMPRADRSYGSGKRRLASIVGRPPNLIDAPHGCRFHPRCSQAMPECRQVMPEPTEVAPGHVVACLRHVGVKVAS